MKPILVPKSSWLAARRVYFSLALMALILLAAVGVSLAASGGWNTVADVRAFDAGQRLAPNAPMAVVNIGDYVWNDTGPNGQPDGLHLPPEQEFTAGIFNVKVNLCADTNLSGVPDQGDDCSRTTTTAADGKYLFTNVLADGTRYFVQIDASNFDPGGALVGHVLTSKNTYGQGNDYVTTPLLRAEFLNADFGFAYPHLTLVKTASPTTYTAVGAVISYSYLLTNSGNVTLVGPFTVTDDKATVTCPATATLASLASITCTASYTITQADLNAGSVKNTAQGHGTFGTTPVNSNNDDETVTAVQRPGLTLVKTASPTTYDVGGRP